MRRIVVEKRQLNSKFTDKSTCDVNGRVLSETRLRQSLLLHRLQPTFWSVIRWPASSSSNSWQDDTVALNRTTLCKQNKISILNLTATKFYTVCYQKTKLYGMNI